LYEKKKSSLLLLATLFIIVSTANRVVAQTQSPLIVVNPTPEIINADGKSHQIIVIQLQTDKGEPYIAPRDTPIYITSSNTNIGTIDEFVAIPEGKSYAKATFTTSKTPGVTIITASSPGYETGSEYLQVSKSPTNARLVVYATPSSQPAVSGEKGKVIVQIVDDLGEPYTAFEDIAVTLTSSNHSVCTVTQNLVIVKGTNYAVSEFTVSGDVPGEATITAQAQGYYPGSAKVEVYEASAKPEALALYFGPKTLLPDGQCHEAVTVQLQDKEGTPVKATSSIKVYLSSSNTNIATVEETITIKSGEYKASAEVTTYSENGKTTISATSPGLASNSSVLYVKGDAPKIVELFIFPDVLLADGSVNEVLTVQLQDENGAPVKARQDTEIRLSSSNTMIGSVPESVIIPQGSSYAIASFASTNVSGTTKILASMMGAIPSEKSVQTIVKRFNMTIRTPSIIKINQTSTIKVEVVSHGIPVEGANIKWTILGGVIVYEETQTDENGVAVVQIVQKYDTLRIKATATKIGYERNEAQKNIQIQTDFEKKELTITILEREIPVFQLFVALAAIIVVILVAYIYIKYVRHTGEPPEDLEIFT